MSVLFTQRLAKTVAFTPPVALARVMGLVGEADPLQSIQAKIDAVLLMRSDVEMRLRKYTGKIYMDPESANRAILSMRAWSNDYGSQILAMDPNAQIPEGMRPALPAAEAKNYVSALFADATYGLHFYENGQVRQDIMSGKMSVAFADSDLDGRIQSFRTLTAMDEDGALARIFGANAVGEPISIGTAIVIVAVIVALAALIAQQVQNAAIRSEKATEFKKLCDHAESEKEKSDSARKAYEKCLDSLKPPPPPDDPINTAVMVLGGALGLFVLGYYVAPKLLSRT